MKYVLLLRGVNVGGKNRVENSRLCDVLQQLGYSAVNTYINSGNAVFSAKKPINRKYIQNALLSEFGFAVDFVCLDANRFLRIVESIPDDWTNDTLQKSDVFFLFPEIDDASAVMKVGYNIDIETVMYVPGALLWNIRRENQSRGSARKIVGTTVYALMTIRNVNTVRALAKLLSDKT